MSESLINSIGRAESWAHITAKRLGENNAQEKEWRRLVYLACEILAQVKGEMQDEIEK